MKLFYSILFFVTICFAGFSQYNIDWRNAPLNPIPVKYTLNHFKLHGKVKKAVMDDLLGKQILFFNSLGKLDSTVIDDFLGQEKQVFDYDSIGNLTTIISIKKYQTPIINPIAFDYSEHLIEFNRTQYKYNQAGYLISVISDESVIQYSYNEENQVVKKEIYDIDNQLELTVYYQYIQYSDRIRITENRVKRGLQMENIWTYEYDTLGHLFFESNLYDSIGNYLGNSPNKTKAVITYY